MAENNVGILLDIKDEKLKDLVKLIKILNKSLKDFKINQSLLYGSFSKFNPQSANWGVPALKHFLQGNFANPNKAFSEYFTRFSNISNYIKANEDNPALKQMLFNKFSSQKLGSLEAQNLLLKISKEKKLIDYQKRIDTIESDLLKNKTDFYTKSFEKIDQIENLRALTKKTRNLLRQRGLGDKESLFFGDLYRVTTSEKTFARNLFKNQPNLDFFVKNNTEKMSKLYDFLNNKNIKNLDSDVVLSLMQQQFKSSKFASIQGKISSVQEIFINKMKKLNKKYDLIGNVMGQFMEKLKTVILYFSVIKMYDFVKDIINVRRELEQQKMLLSYSMNRFKGMENNTTAQNRALSTKTIDNLKSYAKTIGVQYGEIISGFAKIAQNVPKGTVKYEDALLTYKALMKAFVLTGADSNEQTNAIRALYQMMAKGQVVAEEFNRQLGNTPLRTVLMENALKYYNKTFGLTLKNFEDLQKFLKQKNIAPFQFISDSLKQFAADNPKMKGMADFVKNINNLGNNFQDFKQSLTEGVGIFSPIIDMINVITAPLGFLLKIISGFGPLASITIPFFISFFSVLKRGKFSIDSFNASLIETQNLLGQGLEEGFVKRAKLIERTYGIMAVSFTELVSGIALVKQGLSGLFSDEDISPLYRFLYLLEAISGVLQSASSLQGLVFAFRAFTAAKSLSAVATAASTGVKILDASGAAVSSATIAKTGVASLAGTGVGGFITALLPYILWILGIVAVAILGMWIFKKFFTDDKEENDNSNSGGSYGYAETLNNNALIYDSGARNDHITIDINGNNVGLESYSYNDDNYSITIGSGIPLATNN